MGMLAVVLVVVISVVFLSVFQRNSRTTLLLKRKQVTFDGDACLARISPDGQHLAYVRKGGRVQRVLVQNLAGGLPIEILSDKWILGIAWTPLSDELLIGAMSDSANTTFLLPRSGGQLRRYPSARLAGSDGFAWSPNGERFAAANSFSGTINLVEKASGSTTSILLGGVLTNSPQSVDWSSNGNLLVAQGRTSAGTQLWTIRMRDSKQLKILDSTEARRPQWSPLGDAVYYLEPREKKLSDLMKLQVDPETGAARSTPKLLMSGIQTGDDYSISHNGHRMVYTQNVSSSNLWAIDLAGGAENLDCRQITFGTAGVRSPSPAPDGSRLAFVRGIGEYTQIFTMPISGGIPEQITFTQRRNSMPCWSSDGNYIAYISVGEGIARVEVVESNGGTPRVFSDIDLDPDTPGAISWSPGERILFGGGFGYKMLDPSNGRITSLEFSDTIPRVAWQAHYLPGGKRIAVLRGQPRNRDQTQSFFPQIEIISLDSSMSSTVLSQMFYSIIGWSPDGTWLYRIDSEDSATSVVRFNIENARTEKILTIPIKHVSDVVMLPDCSKLACVAVESQTDIWLVENFDPDVK
jgi:Tol biopolymer transport system component